jgi:primosomal protein N'
MYNVLETVRAAEAGSEAGLSARDKTIYEQGLVGIVRQLHDELDEAVFAAYGWPADLSDEDILEKLVALNAERAAEEAQGRVRWLRPAYQAPDEVMKQAPLLELEPEAEAEIEVKVKSLDKQPWPTSMAEQAQAVRTALAALDGPATAKQVAAVFKGARGARVTELLETLVSLGQAREVEGERFVVQ